MAASGGERETRSEDIEDRLIEGSRHRSVVDLGDGGRWQLPASVLRRLCQDRVSEVDRFGLRVAHAQVTGSLDLRALNVPFTLAFGACVFDEPPVVEGADLHGLAIVDDSHLPGLLANGVRIRRDLDLSRAHLDGALMTTASTSMSSTVWLTEAEIGGRFLCVGTRIVGVAHRAIQADRTHFGGNIRLIHGFSTTGEIRLIAVRLDGSLDLTGADLRPTNGRALDLGEAQIGGSIFLIDDEGKWGGASPAVHGRIELGHASVKGRILVRNASLIAPEAGEGGHHYLSTGAMHRCAISAPRLSMVGDLLFEDSCRVEGGIDLEMAEITGEVRLDGQTIDNAGDRSLDLSNATIGGALSARGLQSRGTIELTGARIQGSVRLTSADLSEPEQHARHTGGQPRGPAGLGAVGGPAVLAATGAVVAGDIELGSATASGGQIRLRAATVGANFEAHGMTVVNHGAAAVVLDGTTVGGDVHLTSGFNSDGTVSMVGLTVEGILDLTGATITNAESEPGLVAVNARAEGGMFLRWHVLEPSANFDGASTPALWDDPENWPRRISIAGFEYQRFWKESAPSLWDVRKRASWLERQEPLDAAPYEHLARVLRERGQPQQAETIQVAYLRRERRGFGPRRRLVSTMWDWLTLYGFQPWRVLALLGLLILGLTGLFLLSEARDVMRATGASGAIYTPDGTRSSAGQVTAPCGDGDVRCFRPVLYAIDIVVPLIDLGQRSAWRPETHAAWGSAIEVLIAMCTLLGWTLSTIFALSFTRLARSI